MKNAQFGESKMQVTQEAQSTLFGQTLSSVEQIDALASGINTSEARQIEFRDLLKKYQDDKSMGVPVGIGYYILGQYRQAIEKLSATKDCAQKCVYLGRALRQSRRYDEAVEAFDAALKQKADAQKMTLEKVEALALAGKFDEAKKQLKTLANFDGVSPDYHYEQARVMELQGLYGDAAKEYRKALTLQAKHSASTFRLAFLSDVLGNEEDAIDLYEQITSESPVYISSLMNLAVLYEDGGEYELAGRCVQTVLNSYPNNGRAILFKKDIESAKTMVYDDERERKMDRRNKLLETPITDFELSVRSRNCLRKMNIRTLGDLLRISETELLAYKNFGETSLREIRAILESKNLRLGMALEEKGETFEQAAQPARDNMSDVLNKGVDDLALSVRARKCLERLNVATVGELISKTEAELLGCKNFGVTSLNEIKGKLTDLGLSLRKLD
jgi:DNA-directed RNA polymerase subunit alpha